MVTRVPCFEWPLRGSVASALERRAGRGSDGSAVELRRGQVIERSRGDSASPPSAIIDRANESARDLSATSLVQDEQVLWPR